MDVDYRFNERENIVDVIAGQYTGRHDERGRRVGFAQPELELGVLD
jgi:hypothetical protein